MTEALLVSIAAASGFVVGFSLGDMVRNWLRLERAHVPQLYQDISDLEWSLDRARETIRLLERERDLRNRQVVP